MSTKTTTKKSTGANSDASKNSKKVATNKSGKVTGVTIVELAENTEQPATENVTEQPTDVVATESTATVESKQKAKSEKKVVASKSAKPVTKKTATVGKELSIGGKKIKLVSSCYHYYRSVLRDWLREHKVPSARFQKNPENYTGFVTVLESEKIEAVQALAQYRKENPDVKDLWQELKK